MTEDGVDSISSLPDVILQHIFEFIPTSCAIRTSVLSKRWKHVWSDTPSLFFNLCSKTKPLSADSVNKTLTLYTARKMINFKLLVNEYTPYIDGWIKFVMSRNVEIMSLYLSLFNVNYNFPSFFYINSSVKQLAITYLWNAKIPSCSVSWTSLKKLSLCCYSYLSGKYIDKILSGCPVLESLGLYQCYELEMKVLDLSKSLRLRILELDGCAWSQGPVQIVAPHIHHLKLTNTGGPCTLVDISSLTEAILDPIDSLFRKPKHYLILQDRVLKMLEKLHNVEKLTFGANVFKLLSLAELRGAPFPSFIKVKDLRLETMVDQDTIHGLVRLLQNSPELKKLTIHGTIPEEYSDKLLGFAKLEIRSVHKAL